jgi:protein-S-isoprenylcysteine O-methyltransferase Ste14
MKLLTDWGFSASSWKGERGEYWVLIQGLLILGFVALPVLRVGPLPTPPLLYGLWAIALLLALPATLFIGKGLVDLGRSLTPLPYPRSDGQLVQSGVYAWVRHPIYSGVILAMLAWAVLELSLSHGMGAIAAVLFFNAKASREETWLTAQYPDYAAYQQRVKKLLPGVY